MAPCTWKLLLASATLAPGQHCSVNDSCEDQTALLQSHLASHKSSLVTAEQGHMLNFPKMSVLTDPSKRKVALAQFENTALELAQNRAGVTDEVVEICNVTAALLENTVLQAILSEHDTDVAMLQAAYDAFVPIEGQRAAYETQIEDAMRPVYGDETTEGCLVAHTQCRTEEANECVECNECHVNCTEITEECDNANLDLENKHNDVINVVTTPARCINGAIHPPTSEQYATEVTISDHEENRVKMEAYLAALAAWEQCEEQDPVTVCNSCPPPPHTPPPGSQCEDFIQLMETCDTMQTDCQAAACDARYEVMRLLALYHAAFTSATTRYNNVEASIRVMEADRKVEWDTLERVICLLMTLTSDQDGDAASAANLARIDQCMDDTQIPNGGRGTAHLNIDYFATPDVGTLPTLPANPCSEEFINEHITTVTPCNGQHTTDTTFTHTVIDTCECLADPHGPDHTNGFPYILGPFLLFETGYEPTFSGFTVDVAGASWQATFEGSLYTGRLSPLKQVTIPGLNDAFGLEGMDTAEMVAWAYPDAQGTSDRNDAELQDGFQELNGHRFIRTGGFVYFNSGGQVVAMKQTQVSDSTLGQNPSLTMNFAPGVDISLADVNAACPAGMNPVTLASIRTGGGEEYCWDKSGAVQVSGPHGAFLYKVTDQSVFTGQTQTRYVAYAVTSGAAYDPPDHRPATDQQNAGYIDPSLTIHMLAPQLMDTQGTMRQEPDVARQYPEWVAMRAALAAANQ